jgi:hypothetical protein
MTRWRLRLRHVLGLVAAWLLTAGAMQAPGGFTATPIIDNARRIDWTKVGAGAIPTTRTQCNGTPLAAGSYSGATIAASINGCAAGTFYLLGSGTFTITTTGIGITTNNVTLRGAGPNATILNSAVATTCTVAPAIICLSGGTGMDGSGPNNLANWTAGYAQRATSITLGAVLNGGTHDPVVGDILFLDQRDDGVEMAQDTTPDIFVCHMIVGCTNTGSTVVNSITNTGTQANATSATSHGYVSGQLVGVVGASPDVYNGLVTVLASPAPTATTFSYTMLSNPGVSATCTACYTDPNQSSDGRVSRGQFQMVKVTSVSGGFATGYTVGITPSLYMPNWRSGNLPQAWWSNSPPVVGVGLENLRVNFVSGNFYGIGVAWAVGNWLKNVEVVGGGDGGSNVFSRKVHVWESMQTTIRDSFFFGTYTGAPPGDEYGVDCYASQDLLVENNIFQHTRTQLIAEACQSLVAGYNVFVNDVDGTGWHIGSIDNHSGGANYWLLEGNDAFSVNAENVHGNTQFATVFRNYLTGQAIGHTGDYTAQTVPLMVYNLSRFSNVLANVLGTSGYHTQYQTNAGDAVTN